MTFEINLDAAQSIIDREKNEKVKKGTIVVVDDEDNNISSLERLLEDEYDVFATTDPAKALEYIENNSVDLILSDQRMPVMREP